MKKLPVWAVWLTGMPVNALLGYFCTYPVLMAIYSGQSLLGWMGLAALDPTDNDGALPAVILLSIALVFLTLVFGGANLLVPMSAKDSPQWYWPAAVAVFLAPALITVFIR